LVGRDVPIAPRRARRASPAKSVHQPGYGLNQNCSPPSRRGGRSVVGLRCSAAQIWAAQQRRPTVKT
jgi:hypothetical protein